MKALQFLCVFLLAGCRFGHHQQMTPHWESTTQYTADCFNRSGRLVLEGHYSGQNVYVQNPFLNCSDSIVRFCAYEVVVNDTIIIPTDSLKSSAFQIPLTRYGFAMGDSVHIDIRHYAGGAPKVLNPEVRMVK